MRQNAYLVNSQIDIRQNAYIAKFSNWYSPRCI